MDPTPDVIAQIVHRASSSGYEDWWARVEHAGFCSSPVELRGRDADGRPITILTRCKNRRASVCPSCSALYSGDTWQLVHRGIAKEECRSAPMVFMTLTAPSFGKVHSTNDSRLGEPVRPERYDYVGHVLFTWHAPQLWHRFTVTLRRLVCRTGADRVSYVKVVEMQQRGIPHFHAVVRLDGGSASGVELAGLVHQAAASAVLHVPGVGGELVTLRFGVQTDVQPLRLSVDEDDDRRIASYLAKYVTKSVADFGLSSRRISPQAVETLDVRPHVRQILLTILALADSPGPETMANWLHTLGYRGHITTKTREYSTTMGALRAHRAAWRASRAYPQTDETPLTQSQWRFTQAGHRNDGERLLARTADAQARTSRLTAREELACRRDDGMGL